MTSYPDLAGKVVIVTGGGSGMGRDVCLALGDHGADVVLGNRNEAEGNVVAEAVEKRGGRAVFQPTDVSRPEQCAALVDIAVRAFGRVDCAFNNAGNQRAFTNIDETPDADVSDVVDVNLKGVLYMMKYATRSMLKTGGGVIVNNASIFGLKAMPGLAYYVAAKHGIVGATRAAALDYAERGIRVNAVCPGPIKTPSLDRATKGDDLLYADATPMRRIGMPCEVTAGVLWLLSRESAFVTGTTLSIDGGMSAN